MFLTLEDSHSIFVSEEVRLHNSTYRMISVLFKKKKDVCHVCVIKLAHHPSLSWT